MALQSDVLWERIYHFIMACGNVHEPYQFAVEICSGLKAFCVFDEALVYFLDGNRKVHNQYLVNIDNRWSYMYLEYYSKLVEDRFKIGKEEFEVSGKTSLNLITWSEQLRNEFISDYIRARGLKYTLTFVLYDLNGLPRIAFALDRMSEAAFSKAEITALQLIVPQLNNLHKNFYFQSTGRRKLIWENAGLTERELEVINLLCQGITPVNIGKALRISLSTTYKHIAHVYEKMHVSSQQELLVRLFNLQG